MPYPGLLHPEALPLQQSTADPYAAGDTQTQFWLSLCGVSRSWYTQDLFEPSEHVWREGVDSKCNFTPPTILLMADTTIMAESKKELKSLLMKVKEESKKVGLKLTFRKLRS